MGIEYKIRFTVPSGYDPTTLFRRLPSPIERSKMVEIYNYRVDPDGFYFIDHLVNKQVAAVAFKCFVDAALACSAVVEITEAE